MTVMIVTTPYDWQCEKAKDILKENNIEFDEIVHDIAYHDDYPIIYIDNERLCFRDFIKYMEKKNE